MDVPPIGGHPGGTPGEIAAYRAGVLDARLLALEVHSTNVNGSIKHTGSALQALTDTVNEMRADLRQLDVPSLLKRVNALEETRSMEAGVASYRRWLVATGVATLAVTATVAASLIHLI